MKSFAFHDRIISKALKFCKSAASCTSFHWNQMKTPFMFWTISRREGMNKKWRTLFCSHLIGLHKFQKVFGSTYTASFWRKIWTKRWWYFPIVALHQCKIAWQGRNSISQYIPQIFCIEGDYKTKIYRIYLCCDLWFCDTTVLVSKNYLLLNIYSAQILRNIFKWYLAMKLSLWEHLWRHFSGYANLQF